MRHCSFVVNFEGKLLRRIFKRDATIIKTMSKLLKWNLMDLKNSSIVRALVFHLVSQT